MFSQYLCFVFCVFAPYTCRLVCIQLPCLVYDCCSGGLSLMWGLRFPRGGGGGAPYTAPLMISITTLVVRRLYHYHNSCVLSVVSIELGSTDPKQEEFPIVGHVTTCLPVHCCGGVQPSIITSVFSASPGSGLCRFQPFDNATVQASFYTCALVCVLGYTFFIGGRCMVIIAVTILRLLREPHHVVLTNACSICHIRL